MARQWAGQTGVLFKFLARKKEMFLFLKEGRPAVSINDLPIHWVQWACSSVLKWPVRDTEQYHPFSLSNMPQSRAMSINLMYITFYCF